MAYDKVVDSTQVEANLTAIADAIRAKGGTTDELEFPNEFVSAISAISAGGTDMSNVEIYVADFHEADEISVTLGALDIYKREVVS